MGFSPRFTISSTLMLVFTLFCILVIISISYISYAETSKNIITSFNREEVASENLFSRCSIYIHRGLKLWDSTYNKNLAQDMDLLLEAYNKSGGRPGLINLKELQMDIDPAYKDSINFYFINSSGIIEYTTDNQDYLLDFSIYPDFMDNIRDMMRSDEFFPDEIVKGFDSGRPLRKFAYHSTPDHRYLAQIGLYVQNDSVKERSDLSYGNLAKYILKANPKLLKIDVINSMGEPFIGNNDFPKRKLDAETKQIVESVFHSHDRIVIPYPENMTETVYIFVPNTVDDTPSADYMNFVGEFTYSTEELYDLLNYNLLLHLLIAIIASLFAFLTVILITKRLTGSINTLVNEIDQVAQGNFTQKISETGHPELERIANAVRSMVRQINVTINKLLASESRYRNLFNTATDGILIVDDDLVIDANPVAMELFPDPTIKMGNKYLKDICEPISRFVREPVTNNLQEKSQPSKVSEVDIKIDCINKSPRTLNVRTVPLDTGEHPLLQVQIRDITKKIEMEEKLQEMNLLLEEQVKERTASLEAMVADLDSFSYSVSHDLKAPLRAIDGNAHILMMKGNDILTPDLTKHIDKIHENIRKMDDLIYDLLNFSRISRKSLEISDIDMNQMVTDVMNEICKSEYLPLPSIRISLLPHARGDLTLVRDVLMNLILNAIKFGKPDILNEISIYYRIENGKTWYCIRDNGIGFDMKYADRIFEAFLQLNPDRTLKGTGIGLAIVKRIILRHNGQIRVLSQEGIGSEFSFTLGA